VHKFIHFNFPAKPILFTLRSKNSFEATLGFQKTKREIPGQDGTTLT